MYVICHFSLVAFNILSLSLIFVSLITMCLSVFLLGFILPGTLCASWTWLTISFPMFSKLSAIISSIFSQVLSLSLFSFWDPYNVNVGAFNVVPESLRLLHCFSLFFSIFCSVAVISTILSSGSFIYSASVILLLIPSSVCICLCSLVLLDLW